MPISLDTIGNQKLKIKVLRGPDFEEHRRFVKSLYNKTPIYGIEDGVDKFLYWEVPRNQMLEVLKMFQDNQILAQSDKAKDLIAYYRNLMTPVDKLPKFEGEIKGVKRKLHKYQEDFVRLPLSRNRLICAFDPGLGKSLTSIARTIVLGKGKTLIVCPNSIMENWITEVQESFSEEPSTVIYHGTIKKREKLLEQVKSSEVVVCPYTMVKELKGIQFKHIIIDEAQIVSRMNLKRSAVKGLLNDNTEASVQLLSGTPVLHRPSDLWSLTDMLYPELAGDKEAWKSRYEKVLRVITKPIPIKDRNGQVVINPNTMKPEVRMKIIPVEIAPKNLDELHERTKAYMFRVARDTFVSFEESVDIIKVPLKGKQKTLHEQIGKQTVLQLQNDTMDIPSQLAALTRYLQVCEGAFNLEPDWKDSGKVDFVKEIFSGIDDKLIVWSRFKPITYILQQTFPKELVMLNGDMSKEERALAIWSFQGVSNDQEAEKFKLWRDKYKGRFDPGEARGISGVIDRYSSLGFNLHVAYRQIATSFSWNGTVNEQAFSRIKRVGQTSDVIYTQYLVSDEVERKALSLVLSNLEACQHIVDGKQSVSYKSLQPIKEALNKRFLV